MRPGQFRQFRRSRYLFCFCVRICGEYLVGRFAAASAGTNGFCTGWRGIDPGSTKAFDMLRKGRKKSLAVRISAKRIPQRLRECDRTRPDFPFQLFSRIGILRPVVRICANDVRRQVRRHKLAWLEREDLSERNAPGPPCGIDVPIGRNVLVKIPETVFKRSTSFRSVQDAA